MRSLLILLLLASCARKLEDLAPFPCARDGRCPEGLSCKNGTCIADVLDGFCSPNQENACDVIELGARCVALTDTTGFCALTCSANDHCEGTGVLRRCSDAGVCLVDPSAGDACPAGTTISEVSGLCVPDAAPRIDEGCTRSEECRLHGDSTFQCVDQTCVPPCVAGNACADASRTCARGLVDASRMATAFACFTPCASGSCAEGFACISDPSAIQFCARKLPFGASCSESVQCEAGDTCRGYALDDCGLTFRTCSRSCTTDADCPSQSECSAGLCVPFWVGCTL